MGNFSRTRLARTSDTVDVVADVTAAAALTAAALTLADGAGTNDGTIAAVTDAATALAGIQELAAQHAKVVADLTEIRSTLNDLIAALGTEA